MLKEIFLRLRKGTFLSTELVLTTHHLKKYYRSVHAVEDISLSIRRGEIFGFLGPNGSGKTTTIGMILGLIAPTSGTVEVFGQSITPAHNGELRRVGTMMGAPSMLLGYSARQNLHMLARLYPEVTGSRIEELLDTVGLKDINHRPVKQFSTGMKQRLGMAMSLLGRPDLLILDEPTNGMDPIGMHEMRELLRKLASEGITIFLSSHLLHEMQMICDRAAIVSKGMVVTEGSISDLMAVEAATRIKVVDIQKALSVLKNLDAGIVATQTGSDYLDVRGIEAEKIVVSLVQNEIIPSEVFPVKNNLENVFLQLAHTSGERK
jgi:ABC-type multidrug transport system ATPase subunit